MVILGLDVGDRRVGVAASDASGTLATPRGVIQRRSRAEDFASVARLIEMFGADKVIVGLPLSLDGQMGPQARRVARYAGALARALNIPVQLVDERYSTATADALLVESGRKRRVQIDAAAAAVILQDFLDCQRAQRT